MGLQAGPRRGARRARGGGQAGTRQEEGPWSILPNRILLFLVVPSSPACLNTFNAHGQGEGVRVR